MVNTLCRFGPDLRNMVLLRLEGIPGNIFSSAMIHAGQRISVKSTNTIGKQVGNQRAAQLPPWRKEWEWREIPKEVRAHDYP